LAHLVFVIPENFLARPLRERKFIRNPIWFSDRIAKTSALTRRFDPLKNIVIPAKTGIQIEIFCFFAIGVI